MKYIPDLRTKLSLKQFPKKVVLLFLLLGFVIVAYQNQKKLEQQEKYQERYQRESEQCVKIFEARFGDWPASISEAETLLGEKIDASRAAAAREFDKYRLDRCVADRISREEASETEKARELEIEARTSCAENASYITGRGSLGGLRGIKPLYKTDQEIEAIYRQEMRTCMETRGFEYRE